jgi:hypothetical protein
VSERAEFLRRYRNALRQRGIAPARVDRIVSEARTHLEESAAAMEDLGKSRGEAERTAMDRFGSPEELAATWASVQSHLPVSPLPWIFLTTIGAAAGLLVVVTLGPRVAPLVTMMLLLPAAGFTIGAGLGLGQYFSMRDFGIGWVVLTSAGVSIGITALSVVIEAVGLTKGYLPHDLGALAVIGFGTGSIVGWLQERRLKLWWILVAMGMCLGAVLGGVLATAVAPGIRSPGGFLLIAASAGLVLSTITAPWLHQARVARFS